MVCHTKSSSTLFHKESALLFLCSACPNVYLLLGLENLYTPLAPGIKTVIKVDLIPDMIKDNIKALQEEHWLFSIQQSLLYVLSIQLSVNLSAKRLVSTNDSKPETSPHHSEWVGCELECKLYGLNMPCSHQQSSD